MQDPNAYIDISSPRGGSAIGLPGGGGGGGGDDVETGSWLIVAWVLAWITKKAIYPVVKVGEHVYKSEHKPKPQENESFNASYGRSKSFNQIVDVEVSRWEDGSHTLFKLVFITVTLFLSSLLDLSCSFSIFL